MVEFSGAFPIFFFFFFSIFLTYWWFQTKHKAFRIHKNLQTKPISKNFYFHYLWKLYFGFNCHLNLLYHTISGEVVLTLSSIGKCRWISPLFQIALIVTFVSFTLPKTSSKHYFCKICLANVSKTFLFYSS